MNDAGLYRAGSELQSRDAEEVVGAHAGRVRWCQGGGDSVLDVGCGDGAVSAGVLMRRLPPEARLTAVDLSPTMVRHAAATHRAPNLDFAVMDISTGISLDLFEKYDHVFSFYCLHWVQNQRTAIKNIYCLLKPGGDCLLSFGAKNPIYDVYKILSKSQKWKDYMSDVDRFISPYHFSTDPRTEFEDLLTMVGFRNIYIEFKVKTYHYDGFKNLRKSAFAVNPFLERIPGELQDQYFEDYVAIVRDLGLVEEDNNNIGEKVRIRCPYHSLVAYAVK